MTALTSVTPGGFIQREPDATDSWGTPRWLLDRIGLTYSLDPCGLPEGGNVPAETTYRPPQDGLSLPWAGRVFCNPPYATWGPWAERLADHGNGVLLVFARVDTRAGQSILPRAEAMVFIRSRVKFERDGVVAKAGAGAPSMLLGWGSDCCEAILGAGLGFGVDLRERR